MKALILVDFEKDWLKEGSDYYVGDISEVLERVNKLIGYCRQKGYKIIFTAHVDEDFSGELIDELDRDEADVVITKNRISPFYKTDLEQELEGVDKIVVCGILTNLCVRSLVQDAYDRDFEITVIKDCCVAFDEQTQEFTFKDLKETREEIEFVDFEGFIDK